MQQLPVLICSHFVFAKDRTVSEGFLRGPGPFKLPLMMPTYATPLPPLLTTSCASRLLITPPSMFVALTELHSYVDMIVLC